MVAYETGYLKVHYPVEFMAALLTSVMGDTRDSTAKYIRNCVRYGYRGPAALMSTRACKKFTVSENGKIRFGLLGVSRTWAKGAD